MSLARTSTREHGGASGRPIRRAPRAKHRMRGAQRRGANAQRVSRRRRRVCTCSAAENTADGPTEWQSANMPSGIPCRAKVRLARGREGTLCEEELRYIGLLRRLVRAKPQLLHHLRANKHTQPCDQAARTRQCDTASPTPAADAPPPGPPPASECRAALDHAAVAPFDGARRRTAYARGCRAAAPRARPRRRARAAARWRRRARRFRRARARRRCTAALTPPRMQTAATAYGLLIPRRRRESAVHSAARAAASGVCRATLRCPPHTHSRREAARVCARMGCACGLGLLCGCGGGCVHLVGKEGEEGLEAEGGPRCSDKRCEQQAVVIRVGAHDHHARR